MVKSYPGFGPLFLVLFFFIIGIWMFINPFLNDSITDNNFNYGGLIFTGIGISLTFTLKKITLWNEGIEIKYLVTKKRKLISKKEISQITIEEDNRTFSERFFSTRKTFKNEIKMQFHDKFFNDLILMPYKNTSYYSISDFLRENYPELINEQKFPDETETEDG